MDALITNLKKNALSALTVDAFFLTLSFLEMQTVDQFFTLKVPMRSAELNCVFRGIDNAFQVYANHVIDKLGMCA